jgi:hypothetical protein
MRCGDETGILPPLPLVTMPSRPAHAPAPDIRVRKAARGDLDALVELEERVFATDRLSRRSLRRFLASPSAELVVAQLAERLAGTAIVLFRPRSAVAGSRQRCSPPPKRPRSRAAAARSASRCT